MVINVNHYFFNSLHLIINYLQYYLPLKKMKKVLLSMLILVLTSCSTRIEPNHYGVLMESYGKNGKSDYSKQQGSVWVPMGGMLFEVPAFEQRADFVKEGEDGILKLKSSDNTEFTVKPRYSYKVIESKVVDVVFENARLGASKEFMKSLEDNILEPQIYDLIKEESRKYLTDTLMANGGSLKFESKIQEIVSKAFETKGLHLITFSTNLDFSKKVKDKIDSRNEVNTNLSVLDQQIQEQRKRNELANLKAQENINLSKGLTPQVLQQQFIEAWKETKQPLYFVPPNLHLMQK